MINLLPPQQKEELLEEGKYNLVLILGILFLIFLISLILILFSIKIFISGEVEVQRILLSAEEKRFKESQIQNLEEKINTSNQTLSKLNLFYQNQLNLTEILEKISAALPLEAYLTTFSLNPISTPAGGETQKYLAQVSLGGFSPTREILLGLKEALEKEELFGEIYFPPSNWVKPTDIDFSVTLRITNQYESTNK